MSIATAKLTVLFDPPFWVGLFERQDEGRYEACKVVFGAEPRDAEVYAFLQRDYRTLRFSPSLAAADAEERHVSPKRMQRLVKRQLAQAQHIGTKAQQALKLQQEEGKLARRTRSRAEREAEQARKRALHRAKQKEKHKGH